MEDIINALLDVVRAQHSATEGTDEAPFNMDDIVDMAMNLLGRPDEKDEEQSMIDSIQKTVESLAPDIFPPKTFEEMDHSEMAASAANMIENAFFRNNSSRESQSASTSTSESTPDYSAYSYEEEEEEETQNVGDLNDLIYKNFMEMMGLSTPQVEFPFDRSQIQYGREKSVTEMLAEEEDEKRRQQEEERNRKLSAWELAQNAIDSDEAVHAKEPYIPPVMEEPVTKSASQLAAEAIRRSEEQDKEKLAIERQAEAMMAEAQRRGVDPMKFMLHQQEILQYMEKNSDELVSFEDYEDLSPEEKMEIERQLYIDKQIADGVDPDQVDRNVPAEYIPEELKATQSQPVMGEDGPSTFDEDTLRALSMQVMSENSDMFSGENAEEMAAFQAELFENLKRAMSGAGTAVPTEDITSLLSQAAANQMAMVDDEEEDREEDKVVDKKEDIEVAPPAHSLSAVELAMAAQKAAKPEPQEERKTISAADLAKAAQENAKKNNPPKEEDSLPAAEKDDDMDLSFDDLDAMFDEDEAADTAHAEKTEDAAKAAELAETADVAEAAHVTKAADTAGAVDSADAAKTTKVPEAADVIEKAIDEKTATAAELLEEEDEYEYVDPDEIVLGDHTQAEVDEALENLTSLGLEGDVYERAKRMILLELAGSEAALEAYLYEQENSKKKKANVSEIDKGDLDDLSDFDEDLFEKELEMAMDEDFEDEEETDAGEDDSVDHDDEPELPEDEFDEESSDDADIDAELIEEEHIDADLVEEGIDAEDIDPEGIEEAEEVIVEETVTPLVEEVSERPEEKAEVKEKKSKTHRASKNRKSVVHKKEKSQSSKEEKSQGSKEATETAKNTEESAEERGYQVSVRKPFLLKNSTSFMDKFTDFITENQENRKLSTGFKKLDGMLRYGLHKGSYFVDAQPQYLKNSFMQQMADRAAESGVDVLYISTELSRYDLMADSISRLSYEINGHNPEKAHSVMSIMTGEDGATLDCLADEMNWYRGRISEHLFILDQEVVDEFIDSMEEEASAGSILEELIRSIVREGAHKPVVFIDNIENILSVEDSDDMQPLMDGIRQLAKELSIPIVMSYGYEQAENEEELSIDEIEYHESLGNMCDVYLELKFADMITEDSVELTQEDICEMVEDGESLLIDVLIHRNRRPMHASCQIQGTPKFNFFEE